ncbi:MAG: hypothetical protein JXR07_05845 [Reichenbachiella sp.]
MIINSVSRKLFRSKTLTITRLLSLFIALTVVSVLLGKIHLEESFDQFWENHDRIYRVALSHFPSEASPIHSARNFPGASHLMLAENTGVESQVNIGKDVVTTFYKTKKLQDVQWYWTDSSFFSVFPRKIIATSGYEPLVDIHGVAISESFAKKLFGEEDPINKQFTVNEGWKYNVHHVFEDLPTESHVQIEILGTYKTLFYYMQNFDNAKKVLVENPNYAYAGVNPYKTNAWGTPENYRPYAFIKLKENESIEKVENSVSSALKKVALPENLKNDQLEFVFQPIQNIHLQSHRINEANVNGSSLQIKFLYIICAIVWIVSFLNFVNLNVISALDGQKSYSIKMIIGSQKSRVFRELWVESFALVLLAILLSLPVYYGIVVKYFPDFQIDFKQVAFFGIFNVFSSLLSALISFIILFKQNIFNGLKSYNIQFGTNAMGRKSLVVFQFAVTIVLIISTFGILKQMKFMMSSELGFNDQETIFCYSPMTMNQSPKLLSNLKAFKHAISTVPGIAEFAVSSTIPGENIERNTPVIVKSENDVLSTHAFKEISIDENYFNTYQIEILHGRNFKPTANWNSNEVLVNESAVKHLGFSNPLEIIGEVVKLNGNFSEVVGVVNDYHHRSLKEKLSPIIFSQSIKWDQSVGFYSFKVNGQNLNKTVLDIEQIWNDLYPGEEFIYYQTDGRFQEQYESDMSFYMSIGISAGLALFISCLGLLSLAFYNSKRRIKEIGIRKVSGASSLQLMGLLNKDFLQWVLIAFILACPIAWYSLDIWLQNFAYRTEVNWWVFVLSGGLVSIISLLTVSWQSWQSASKNPVEALRYE